MDVGQKHMGEGLDEPFGDGLPAGTLLLHGQFKIEKFLNAGGFGVTYLAKDSLDRTVVIKECFPSSMCRRQENIVLARSPAHQKEFESVVKHFGREARRLSKLDHPPIVGIHQVFEDNQTAYMALDFVRGRDLLDIIDDPRRQLHPMEIKDILLKVLEAVHYIHSNDVLHRDISPDNILIDEKGDPVLIDFGAANEKATRASRALSALHVVKDGYSPHEFYLAGSNQDASSDLYSLGATMYHVLTGEAPPDSQTRVSAIAGDRDDPYLPLEQRIAGFDPLFLAAIDQSLNVFPADRIQTAREWIELVDTEKRRSAALAQAERDREIEMSIHRLVTETNKAVHADIQAREAKARHDQKEAERQRKLAEEQATQRKKTLDELAALDDEAFLAEQRAAQEAADAHNAFDKIDPDVEVNSGPKKRRSLLSRLFTTGILRGSDSADSHSDIL